MKKGEINTKLSDFGEIRRFIVDGLNQRQLNKRTMSEALLIFEALYNDMIEQGIPQDTRVRVRCNTSLGDTKISIAFEGGRYVPLSQQNDGASAEAMIMKAYAEKIEHRYTGGYNKLVITAKRSYSATYLLCAAAVLLATLVYIPEHMLLGRGGEKLLLDNLVFPLEKLFANAMLMVGAPVTFFSLLRNLSDAYIVAERDSSLRKLRLSVFASSAGAVVLAVAMNVVLTGAVRMAGYTQFDQISMSSNFSLPKLIESVIPPSLFEPFETFAPFPIIVLSALTVYALCSIGDSYDSVRRAVDVCYEVFSRMLAVIMFFLPLFCFLAFQDVLLDEGIQSYLSIVVMFAAIIISLAAPAFVYLIRLKVAGVDVRDFCRKLMPLLRENLMINSAIDAAPFNIRYCTTVFGFDRKRMDTEIPVLAQINLDGNCFIITMSALMILSVVNVESSWFTVAVIGLIVFFMSMGAPNQPGSTLIGLLVIINYLNSGDYICIAIYAEAILGGFLNLTNIVGDIVTVAAEDARLKKAAGGKGSGKQLTA